MLSDAGITDMSDENIFIAAACKEKGIAYLKGEATIGVRKISKKADAGSAVSTGNAEGGYTVSVNGKKYEVVV